jgi:diamine N-acetyltransferase
MICVEGAATSGRLVGYVLSHFLYSTFEGRSIHMEDIYVDPDFRGKGVGTRLWQTVAQVSTLVD